MTSLEDYTDAELRSLQKRTINEALEAYAIGDTEWAYDANQLAKKIHEERARRREWGVTTL